LRIVSRASSSACGVIVGTCGVGWPSYTSSIPPFRSRPSFVDFVEITKPAAASSSSTIPRIEKFLVRLVIAA
jgi:hypothetical protein